MLQNSRDEKALLLVQEYYNFGGLVLGCIESDFANKYLHRRVFYIIQNIYALLHRSELQHLRKLQVSIIFSDVTFFGHRVGQYSKLCTLIISYYIITFLNYYYSLIFSDFHWIHSSMRANRGEIQEKPRTRRRTKGTHNFRNFRELFVNMSTNSFGLSTLATIDDMLPHFVQIFGRMLPNVATF